MSGDRTFCGPIPQVSTMELVDPKDMHPSCKPNAYHKSLIPVVITPLILIILIATCGCCFCIKIGLSRKSPDAPMLSSSMGVRSSLLRGNGMDRTPLGGVSLNTLYSDSKGSFPILAVLSALITVVGLAVVYVGSDQIHGLTFSARQIFIDHIAVYTKTLGSAITTLGAEGVLDGSNSGVGTAAASVMDAYAHKAEHIEAALAGLDGLRTAFLIVTGLAVGATLVGGLAAHGLKLKKTTLALAVVGIIALVAVWINFLIYLTAANVISDMCVTINGCHFSCESDTGCDPKWCAVPFFATLSACPDSAANMFQTITDVAGDAADNRGGPVLTAIDDLCASGNGVTCSAPGGHPSVDARVANTLVCKAGTCFAIPAVAKNTTGDSEFFDLIDAASKVTGAQADYDVVASVQTSLQSLNCAANNAFVESVPLGSYNLLQQTLCPRLVHPVNPPQKTFSVTASGLLVVGFVYPIYVLWLVFLYSTFSSQGTGSGNAALLGLSH